MFELLVTRGGDVWGPGPDSWCMVPMHIPLFTAAYGVANTTDPAVAVSRLQMCLDAGADVGQRTYYLGAVPSPARGDHMYVTPMLFYLSTVEE